MKGLVHILLGTALAALVLGVAAKYIQIQCAGAGTIAGIGPRGYLIACGLILLISANLALLELLKKK